MNQSQRKLFQYLGETLVVCFLYILTARLGFLVALPPGIVTSIWPPSGLALAAVLVLGWHAIPGIFTGSLLVNWSALSGPLALPTAAAIAAGSTLQAGVTVWLLRRALKTLPPETISDTLASLGLFFYTTLIAASVGVTSLTLAGYSDWNSFQRLFLTWWFGDLIGITVITPFTIMFLHQRRHARPVREPALWPIASLIIGLSLLVFMVIEMNEEQRLASRLQSDIQEIADVVHASVDRYDIQAITALQGFFVSSTQVNKAEFTTFTRSVLSENKALTVLMWTPRLTQAELPAFTEAMRAQGFNGVNVYQTDQSGQKISPAARSDYYPVMYAEPLSDNQDKLGFDLASIPAISDAIREAVDSQGPAVSRPVILSPGGEPVLFFLAPVMAAESHNRVSGLAVGVFRLKNMVTQAVETLTAEDISISLFDNTDPSNPQLLFFLPPRLLPDFVPSPHTSGLTPADIKRQSSLSFVKARFTVGVHDWLLAGQAGPSYEANFNRWVAWLSLVVGLLSAGAFLAYVSYRQRMESALRKRDQESRLIAENTGDFIWIYDIESGQVVFASPGLTKMLGYSVDEAMHSSVFDSLTPESVDKVVRLLAERITLYLQKRQPVTYTDELDQIHKNGSIINTEVTTTFAMNEAGKIQVVGISRDISERKRAALLQETIYRIADAARSVDTLQDLYPQIHQHIAKVMKANNFFIALREGSTDFVRFVYAVDEKDTFNDQLFDPGSGLTAHILKTGKSFLYMHEKPQDAVGIEPIGAPANTWLGVPLIVHDVTIGVMAVQDYSEDNLYSEHEQRMLEFVSTQVATAIDRKRAEEAVRLVEKRNRILIEHGSDGIVLLDAHGVFSYASPSVERIFGYTPDELLGKNSSDFLYPEDLPILDEIHRRIQQTPHEIFNIQYRFMSKDGSIRWIESTYNNMFDETGVNALVINFRDITERKQSEVELRQANERFRQLADNIQETFWMLDLQEMKLVYISPAYETTWGRSRDSLLENRNGFIDTLLPADQARLAQALERQAHGEPTELEYRIQRPDGSLRWIWDRSFPVFDEIGRLVRTAGVATDITDLKTAQLALEELNRDLEQRVEERTAALRQSEATYRALFENSNDAIFLFSLDGKTLLVNNTALSMTGYTWKEYQEIHGTNVPALVVDEEQADAQARFEAILRGEVVPLYERTFITKSRQRITVEVNLSAVRDHSGRIFMVQSVVRDITARKKAEEALRQSRDELKTANIELEKASRLKDEFLASMSHELRTPLTGILGLSESLQLQTYGLLNDKQFKAVQNIEASGRHLLELINDILDLSKISAGKLEMQFDVCQVSEICKASLQMVSEIAHQKKQIIGFSMNPANLTLRADPRRLRQMLVNLLSNAVKFTPEGGRVSLEVIARVERSEISFCISDTGIGIRSADLPRLFQSFVQLDSRLSRQYPGSGLGLSLVKGMAELHGGRVEVESVFGEGSRFTLFLPWDKSCQDLSDLTEDDMPPEPSDTPEIGTGPLIAIADDNAVILQTVKDFLKAKGCRVIAVQSGKDLLDCAADVQPDLFLIDLQMPGLDGLETIRRLRQHPNPRIASLPIIAVTAYAMSGDRERCLQAGATGYLSKPLVLKELLERIQALI